MADFFYVLGTLLFFAAMYGYVRACAALGARGAEPEGGYER